MLETLPLLQQTKFPSLSREGVTTLQVNLGYLCNQQCLHCHVNAGPKRTELMDEANIDTVLAYLRSAKGGAKISTLDLTGGAPEMNPHFHFLVSEARKLGVHVMDRCNLTILEEPEYEGLAEFLAAQQVEVVASMPCYQKENVDDQRGKGVYDASIRGLQRLNRLGYSQSGSGLVLNLVYNPGGPFLPPGQSALEADYKQQLRSAHGIEFNQLLTLANMPIQRFGSTLISRGQFDEYMALLTTSHSDANLATVMCRSLLSVDWQGYVYDCDFNQMLKLPITRQTAGPTSTAEKGATHLSDLLGVDLAGEPIVVSGHCYGCTAGQGSSCGGALS
ncbi:MAG: arsenosugar biosynthesis radical SAM protein ArsS [Gammaproteobacteria bacterium]|nr:arsenosugar biosynthesis radical SAM protein ArsS [Gammaproteobacteria bacterium]